MTRGQHVHDANCSRCMWQALQKAGEAKTSATAASDKVSAALTTVDQILTQLCKRRLTA